MQVPRRCASSGGRWGPAAGCGGRGGFAFLALRGGNSTCKASSTGSTNVLSSRCQLATSSHGKIRRGKSFEEIPFCFIRKKCSLPCASPGVQHRQGNLCFASLLITWEDDSLPFFTVGLFLLQLKTSLF